MKIVTIDNGNTHTTVGVFDQDKLLKIVPIENFSFSKSNKDVIAISSVGKNLAIKPTVDIMKHWNDNFFFDMPVDYSKTLGEDRLITSYFLYKTKSAGEKILLIDAGTFITYDLISDNGYEGGFILPGLNRFLSIFSESANLPNLTIGNFYERLKSKVNSSLPSTTNEAILDATQLYAESVATKIIEDQRPSRIILTGGGAELILNALNSKFLIEQHPHLVHLSLKKIVDLHFHQALS